LLVEMARLELKSGNFPQGTAKISEASALVEKLRSTAGTPASRASYLESARSVHETQVELLMEWDRKEPKQGHVEEAFAAAERARSRVLLESIPEAQSLARESIDPKLAAQRASMQSKLRRMTDTLSRTPRNSAAGPVQGEMELDRIREQIEQLEAQLRAGNARYRDLSQTEPLTLAQIREQVLDPDTVLISYFLGDQKSYAWLISKTAIHAAALPGRLEIDTLARKFHDELSDSKKAENRKGNVQESSTLGSLVLGPFQEYLDSKQKQEGKRLLLVLDGGLQFVSFQALLAQKEKPESAAASAKPLLHSHEIVVLPSASVLAALRRMNSQRKRAPKTLAMFADPVFAPDETRVLQRTGGQSSMAATRAVSNDILSPLEVDRAAEETDLTRSGESIQRLKFAAQEANGILALVPPGQRLRAMDFDANLRAATDAALAQYRILHYATHGIVNSDNPELSGLVLSLVDTNGRSRDGFLRLPDIYQMRLNADLVVLSACQTALGKVVRSEGLVGLTRGFFYAGATRVVSSLWKVDDEATAELMLRFYRNMLGPPHLRPAAALRAAQLSLASEERWHDPYYWAGFILQGEWR
jgi:CHAT domain-containing protein